MELFFDTETTGFLSDKLTPDDPKQAVVLQLGYILSTKDRVYHEGCILFNIHDKEINKYAQEAHGISIHESHNFGIEEVHGWEIFYNLLCLQPTLIAHNFNFDIRFLRLMSQNYHGDQSLLNSLTSICTMMESTNHCKLPKTRGVGYKWPKLEELHKLLFEYDFEGAHNALSDCHATRKCFYKLVEMGVIKYEL
jgi:DNA polymerase-3 subunit epsilon